MMKKGDIKTRFEDAKNVFPLGKLIIRTPFLFLFLFSNLFSQSTLNNFGASEFVKTYSGYSKFTLIDYDNDGVKDLFLYGSNTKSFVIHRGLKDSTFAGPIKKFFFFPIDDIKWLTKTKKGDDYYIFVSRNKRLAGLVSFTNSYSLQLLHTIEFNSYPSSIKIADLNDNGTNEALIYGNNFNGIQHLRNKGFKIETKEINDENVFSDLTIKDFNQDGVMDIVATDILKNTITFLENSEVNGFVQVREIELEENLFSLQVIDYDNDSFNDLVISKENGLDIFLGDSVNSYSNKMEFNTSFTPEPFIITDIYEDSFLDLVSINNLDDQLVLFSNIYKNENPIKIKFDGISDVNLLVKKNKKSLLALSKKGRILIINSAKKWGKTFSYSLGGTPANINNISWIDSSYSKIFINNSADNEIDILTLDSLGVFSEIGFKSVLNPFSNFSISSNGNIIVCYTAKNRLLEINSSGVEDKINNNPNFIYSYYPIENVIVDNQNTIQVMELYQNELFHESIIKKNGKYISKEIFSIDSSVIKSQIVTNSQIYYWTKNKNQYQFKESISGNIKLLLNIIDNDSTNKSIKIIQNRSNSNIDVVTIFSDGKKDDLYLWSDYKLKLYKSNSKILPDDNLKNNFVQYYSPTREKKLLFVYNPVDRKMLEYNLSDEMNTVVLRKTIEGIDLDDYFINSYFNKMYLIYSDKIKNCLTFRILD